MKKFYLGLSVACLLYGCATTPTEESSSSAAVKKTFSSQKRVNSDIGCHDSYNNCMNGTGVYLYQDGSRYKGEFRAGKKHGKGVLTFADGDYYDGYFQNNNRHGFGVFEQSDGYRYEGEWQDDKPEGRGLQIRTNGERYEGEFQQGKRHGRGEYQWPSGNRHVGEWRNGKKHGRGIHIFADGGLLMREWESNQIIKTGRKVEVDYAQMVEAFFRHKTGINPHNEEEFVRMLEAFLKRRIYQPGDNTGSEFGEIVTAILDRESSGNETDKEAGKELGNLVEEMLIREGYYIP